MADFTFLRKRALASRKPARRSRISASKPPASPAFTMLMNKRLKTRGCFEIDSLNVSPPWTRAMTPLITLPPNSFAASDRTDRRERSKLARAKCPPRSFVENCRSKKDEIGFFDCPTLLANTRCSRFFANPKPLSPGSSDWSRRCPH